MFICSLLIVYFLFFDTELFQSIQKGEIKTVSAFLEENIYYALMFSLFIMIIQNSFTIIPLLFVITLNYYLFGFLYGFIWSWFSSILAAMIIFLAVRYWFQEIVLAKKYVDLLKRMEARGIYYVIYGRIFPFFPTSILNIIAGISTISFKSFIIGTAIGNFFYFFILALIPLGLFSLEIHPAIVVSIILFTIIVFYSIKKMKPRCMQNIKKIKQRFY
ncbi:TVP38/TMEM64 family protein [Niallia sp. 03190]|uniref:TVP38/TMEM64 family protein n=1 Tax=Niallia sp. 03190 TaxID=3458061 RepID=UPI0040450A9D